MKRRDSKDGSYQNKTKEEENNSGKNFLPDADANCTCQHFSNLNQFSSKLKLPGMNFSEGS